MKDAIVLLMHQGNSFTRELNALLATRDIAIVAISSLPPDQDVFDRNKPLLDDWVLAERAELAQADIDEAVRTFERRGYRLLAAIATFEGYRLLMADLNRALGTRDAPREALELGLDKFRCRDFLRRAGLSAVECIPLDADADADGDPARLDLDPSRRWFVKPVRGAASFGCFILDSARDLDDLPRMRAQMLGDRKLSAIFMGKYGFFAEEYVEGRNSASSSSRPGSRASFAFTRRRGSNGGGERRSKACRFRRRFHCRATPCWKARDSSANA
ncbi:hypothetical protein [Burkholderia sp. MSMB1589WGS]|uniref:hypothetical protein n=1 Tax=Burkholderia sp. MSMB1589WGS TaxID=1636425 RepID=UPI000AE0BDC3|nr:hypothetical protein [Burkholderia sp. MSMB1589WGS]